MRRFPSGPAIHQRPRAGLVQAGYSGSGWWWDVVGCGMVSGSSGRVVPVVHRRTARGRVDAAPTRVK